MVKETVTMLDESKKEINVSPVGVLTADIILDNNLKLNKIVQKGDSKEVDLTGSSLMLIRGDFLKKGLDVDPDTISIEDADRIYKKYYEKIVNLAMGGMGGNPN
jgi:hypothetical protein